MIQLIARIEAHPNQGEQLASIIEGVIAPSRAEESCLTYQAHRAIDDPNVFYFLRTMARSKRFRSACRLTALSSLSSRQCPSRR